MATALTANCRGVHLLVYLARKMLLTNPTRITAQQMERQITTWWAMRTARV